MMEHKEQAFFSPAEIKAVLGSAEGKQLLELLNQDGGALLKQAAESIQKGDQQNARQLLEPLMQSGEAADLIRKINDRKNRNG